MSRDLDLFHDTDAALAGAWQADREALLQAGCELTVVRERPTFVETDVRRGADVVIIQWTRASASRFFPLVEHPDLGLTLHPFDLATSKVLALVGRVEPPDFVDTLMCDQTVTTSPSPARNAGDYRQIYELLRKMSEESLEPGVGEYAHSRLDPSHRPSRAPLSRRSS